MICNHFYSPPLLLLTSLVIPSSFEDSEIEMRILSSKQTSGKYPTRIIVRMMHDSLRTITPVAAILPVTINCPHNSGSGSEPGPELEESSSSKSTSLRLAVLEEYVMNLNQSYITLKLRADKTERELQELRELRRIEAPNHQPSERPLRVRDWQSPILSESSQQRFWSNGTDSDIEFENYVRRGAVLLFKFYL